MLHNSATDPRWEKNKEYESIDSLQDIMNGITTNKQLWLMYGSGRRKLHTENLEQPVTVLHQRTLKPRTVMSMKVCM